VSEAVLHEHCPRPLERQSQSAERRSVQRKCEKCGLGEGLDHSHGREKERQNYLGVTFDIESLPNVDFARKIEVEAIQEFLCYINAELLA
jgi:hypothetical protein